MGVFEDKTYNNLDWLSKATEPYASRLNSLLENMPNEIYLNAENILNRLGTWGGLGLSKSDLVETALGDAEAAVTECYDVEVSPNTTVDFESNTIDGKIKVYKKIFTIADETLHALVCDKLRNTLYSINTQDPVKLMRAEEITMLLTDAVDNNISGGKKIRKKNFRDALTQLVTENTLNIKSTELWNKIFNWIIDYTETGYDTYLINLTKIKIMSKQGHAIYTMEEHK